MWGRWMAKVRVRTLSSAQWHGGVVRRNIGTVLLCDHVMAAEAQPMKVGVIPSVTPFIVCHLPPLISAFYHAHFAPPTTRYVSQPPLPPYQPHAIG